jgi:hypothetical protein
MNSGLVSLLVSIYITCCSLNFPPPSFFNPPLHGNNGEALLHIVIPIEEVFQRDPMVPDRLAPVDPFAVGSGF